MRLRNTIIIIRHQEIFFKQKKFRFDGLGPHRKAARFVLEMKDKSARQPSQSAAFDECAGDT
jgi:hypothetical protein